MSILFHSTTQLSEGLSNASSPGSPVAATVPCIVCLHMIALQGKRNMVGLID